ncbi:LOW QUALITY PROTEIN: ATP-dependent RNA helicase DDX54-like [Manduca sexta]|uniref:LOW QUALITY PROTEIN: ATP-dependent RNA helicase DDX54-like n=1 Tax=Manduca sexta TaxID=7130 RepID=UPI00188F7A19|nr:LOW QUALITY PROTEIN: ATP-dependent RNA helicase DDX54-like [Manduca sexta]
MLKPKELGDELPGFDAVVEDTEQKIRRPTKRKKKGSGGFQSMGLSFPVLKGVTKRGYKQPTPIQRKTIPLALSGKDVVAMARTGSGKTASFVLPILEKLLSPNSKPQPGKNLRALILSPTRELALQTLRFVRELGKFTGLSSAAILGGESIEQQFSVMSGKAPDIVVATPGRFLHICIEMSLKLDNIKVVVFDEADRLFELGFGEQLQEIVARLPSSRQTLLFSATLPKMLVEFARAGLSDPMLIRLDVDWKLPSTLWLGWISVRAELKTAALLLLLDKVLTPETPQAVVFAATRHHVEYLHLILQQAGITSTYAYSGLDPSARKIALGRFTNKKVSVLIVTDVAARGLDLPALDTVINYNFPAKPKLFVHRVGRSARAGRAGRAFSLIAAEDIAHLLDLQLFLGAELLTPASVETNGPTCPSGVWGAMPTVQLELRHQDVVTWEKNYSEIEEAVRTCSRGWQQYVKWREPASAEANKRAKTTDAPTMTHPFLVDDNMDKAVDMVQQIKNYTPKGTILELSAKNDSPSYLAMKAKKQAHGKTVAKIRDNKKLKAAGILVEDMGQKSNKNAGKKKKEVVRDENYIPHQASDQHTEMGMAVNFNAGAESAALSFGADSAAAARSRPPRCVGDRKRKKMVHVDPDGGRKMIRTESGGRVPATYRSGRYNEWKKRNAAVDDDDDDDQARDVNRKKPVSEFRPHWVKHNERVAKKAAEAKSKEFRDKQQIVKERLRKDKVKQKLKYKVNKKKKRK